MQPQPAASASTRSLMKRAQAALEKHKGEEALQLLQQVLAINPNHAEALCKVGFIFHSAGRYDQASDFYQRAIHADYTYIESYLMLTKLLETQRRNEEAIRIAKRATEVAPDNPRTHAEYTDVLTQSNLGHLVPAYLEEVMPNFPKAMNLQQIYCMSLKINDRLEEAEIAYQKMIREHRVPAAARILFETYLPRLYRSAAEIDHVREAFRNSLLAFIKEKPALNLSQFLYLPTFQLAYHNRDNKELLKLYVKMLRLCAPVLNYTAPHCKAALSAPAEGKLRVGFVSALMHNHSVGNCYRGVMIDLAQHPDMEVTFFNLSHVNDDKMEEIRQAHVPIISLPKVLEAQRDVIAKYKLDILIYTDIGMESSMLYLAMARLARYQCVFQGHPETTGVDTIDYVISSRSYEPPHADENYTERLLCTDGIDTIFRQAAPPAEWLPRHVLGLPEGKKLYICPMAIQKFHPDFDGVLADILARDANAVIVLFNDFQQQSASALLQERILKQCDATRVLFMPWLPHEVLFSVMKSADVLLDTVHFGGGTTIQYAFGFDIPVVTMPGRYARGRVVYSYYALMGIADAPLADSLSGYAELAVNVANDAAYREHLVSAIAANKHKLFVREDYSAKVAAMLKDMMTQNLEAYRR